MQLTDFLAQYDIGPWSGFLPSQPPLTRLPRHYSEWEDLAAEFAGLLGINAFRKHVARMPVLDAGALSGNAELERAMLLLSCFAHGYVWESEPSADHLPACIAVPWQHVSERLGRIPSLAHASLVTQNWALTDPQGHMTADNLRTLIQFNEGLQDESWFYLVTVEVEAKGASVIREITELVVLQPDLEEQTVRKHLEALQNGLIEMCKALLRMYDHCQPEAFYTRLRPFLASFEEVEYRGCTDNPRSYYGASAAQSALLQSIDAAFGIEHLESESSNYLLAVRANMPPGHRQFIQDMEKIGIIDQVRRMFPAVRDLVAACQAEIVTFRQVHLEMVARYIMGQIPRGGPGHTGTGGTSPMTFLKQIKQDSER